jgi:5,10-methylenetetrahydromethanopterin reductase
MDLEMSCAFAPSLDAPEHIRVAEELGFKRAYLYDSPALFPDVWVQLCRAGERTDRIGLGPAVLIPSCRHVMTNAAAAATLVSIVGENRVSLTVGSGFTGRLSMGQRPLKWSYVAEYVAALRGLLRGDTVEWEGAPIRMFHAPGFGPDRPIEVEVLIAAAGPKGVQVAHDHGDGAFGGLVPIPGFERSPCLTFGTVLDSGETADDPRAWDAAAYAVPATAHWGIEFGGIEEMVPRGAEWLAAYDDVPRRERHLVLHDHHLNGVNDRDRPFIDGDLLADMELALSREAWLEKLEQLEQAGASEVVFQPFSPDIPRELEAFASLFA